jgi:hypothetical protein
VSVFQLVYFSRFKIGDLYPMPHVRTIPLFEVVLDLAYGHATSAKRGDIVVKFCPSSLMLRDRMRLKAAVSVARHVSRQIAQFALKCFLSLTVSGLAGLIGDRLVLAVIEVFGHLRVLRTPCHRLSQALK